MITPAQINSKQFKVVHLKSGYDQEEVDDFLDRIQEDYDWLYQRHQGTPAQGVTQVIPKPLGAPLQAPAEPEAPSDMIAKVLKVAEETAEKHVHDGKVDAEQIRLKARDEAEVLIGNTQMDAANIIENARKQAEAIVSEASSERHRIIGELEERRLNLKEKVDELIRVETEVTTRLRTALERWNS